VSGALLASTVISLPKEPLQEPADQATVKESKSQYTTANQHTKVNQGTGHATFIAFDCLSSSAWCLDDSKPFPYQ
jgi:hypothetical protein